MIRYSLQFAKRFAILIPGILISALSVHNIFPYFDQRLPVAAAVFSTYVIGAYVLTPALIRLVRIVRPASHLPLYCVTPDGFASDPLNVGIVGTRRELIVAMEAAGWYVADPHSLKNIVHQVVSTLFGGSYPNSPVSSLYLFGRRQDIAFEIPIEGSLGSRHHVRFWATTYEDTKRFSVRSIHWHHRRSHVQGANLLWMGAASLDVGVALIRHNFQVTHMIHPDTDQERHLIIGQLQAMKLVESTHIIKLGNPYRLVNRALRGYLQSDGKLTIVRLKARKLK